MSAVRVPKTITKLIDKKMRAFFWTGEDSCHGSKCLVAWDAVQAPKSKGGLGIKDLELQNRCLLLKFIDKLYSSEQPCWKQWVLQSSNPVDTTNSAPAGFLWRIITDELPTFRSITKVRIHNGASTSFWLDHWLPNGPLASTHAALFSHTTAPNISVQRIFQDGFDLRLRPRITNAASLQLDSLLLLLQDIHLDGQHDTRLLKLTGKPFRTKDAYAALDSAGDSNDAHGCRIWETRLPNKIKIFAWLYFKDRLSTRVNLHAKNVIDGGVCERCSQHEEDREHVFFGCTESSRVWELLGLRNITMMGDDAVWNAGVPQGLDSSLWSFVFLAILWRIWDARNGHVFRRENFCSRVLLAKVCDDLLIWRHRLPRRLVDSLRGWCEYISCCNPAIM
jgi:hypothetical protein